MRQVFILIVGILCLPQLAPLFAAEERESAAALAARQSTDDEIRRLRGDVQILEAANANLQKRINQLADELQRIREEQSRSVSGLATKEDVNRLAKDVRGELRDLDSKRVADNSRVLEALEKLSKTSVPATSASVQKHDSPPPDKSKPDKTPPTEKGYWYEIKKGDTFAEIIQACRKQGVNVTSAQVKEANPDINPNKIRSGQKLWIPDPSLK
ncbi:MAG: LysM peptidoglycan-binding domain-containing protein [Verrucomicrobia bacterium]|nr:LysM peptidoglycan-binding domain-containing protein [Verrucomicrobiota bacterium]